MSRQLDLVLDTSRMGIALGIYDSTEPVAEFFEPEIRGENLGHALDAAFEKSGVSLDDVKRVLVTLGPGSFTGLRTGIAFCEGLCFSGKRSLFGISTLRALRSLSEDPSAVVVLRARTGFWYVGTEKEELFIAEEDALTKFDNERVRSFVVDAKTAENGNFKNFADKVKASVIVSKGSETAPFVRFFDELEPSLVQSANYIQPSYYERRGAQGVQR